MRLQLSWLERFRASVCSISKACHLSMISAKMRKVPSAVINETLGRTVTLQKKSAYESRELRLLEKKLSNCKSHGVPFWRFAGPWKITPTEERMTIAETLLINEKGDTSKEGDLSGRATSADLARHRVGGSSAWLKT